MQFPHAKILVFCKAPEIGKVKTRLAKDIGDLAAVDIHKYLTQHCLQQLMDFSLAPIELWCSPDTSHDFFLYCQSNFDITLKQQVGDDLGQRMEYAMHETLQHHSPVAIVGTDCPGLSENDYRLALLATDQNKTVIGPAEDGGYVLLAANQIQPKIFANISWGTSQVYAQTVTRLTGKVQELSMLWDVDYVGDLRRLRKSADELKLDDQFKAYLTGLKME